MAKGLCRCYQTYRSSNREIILDFPGGLYLITWAIKSRWLSLVGVGKEPQEKLEVSKAWERLDLHEKECGRPPGAQTSSQWTTSKDTGPSVPHSQDLDSAYNVTLLGSRFLPRVPRKEPGPANTSISACEIPSRVASWAPWTSELHTTHHGFFFFFFCITFYLFFGHAQWQAES